MKSTQINFTVSAAEKQRIAKLAKSCGLKQGEYLRQRSLGYEPRAFPLPEQFWSLHDDLLRLLKKPMSPELEAEVESTLNRFRATFFSPGVQTPEEIRAELSEV